MRSLLHPHLLCLLVWAAHGQPPVGHRLYTNWAEGFKLLDHNADGVVVLEEAAEGLLTLGQARPAQWSPWTGPTPSCDGPTKDTVYFLDCVVETSRARLTLHPPHGTQPLDLDAAVGSYLGSCTDHPTPQMKASGQHCSDVVGLDAGRQAMGYNICEAHPQHCDLSCYRCAKQTPPTNLTTPTQPTQQGGTDGGLNLWITSDWHVEPWYEPESTAHGVTRFSQPKPDLANMWQCRSKHGKQVPCLLNGHADPPPKPVEGSTFLLLWYLPDWEPHHALHGGHPSPRLHHAQHRQPWNSAALATGSARRDCQVLASDECVCDGRQ
eukprot:NODE_355_length_1824_cov_67.461972_g260_i0.p1 GENE.NODE_355_length_1824_cov_67.461972_g260_i0~~NODE_355_length_1824_cov_67.461972_g260_i0.p1  ORF type:complete len:349 (+),score=78.22 NODE_355_length_1824_cov_67.461972_g260_i0:79-1047(+)